MANFSEKKFNWKFRRYAKNMMKDRTFVYELKVSKKDYLNFKALQKHQEHALLAAKHGIAHHKLPDDSFHGARRPFDGFQLVSVPAYIGVMFRITEQQKKFYLIDIDDFLETKKKVGRKSLTEEKAAEIGEGHTLN